MKLFMVCRKKKKVCYDLFLLYLSIVLNDNRGATRLVLGARPATLQRRKLNAYTPTWYPPTRGITIYADQTLPCHAIVHRMDPRVTLISRSPSLRLQEPSRPFSPHLSLLNGRVLAELFRLQSCWYLRRPAYRIPICSSFKQSATRLRTLCLICLQLTRT
jgi:hypothetical protein